MLPAQTTASTAVPTAGNPASLQEVNNSYKSNFSPFFEADNPEKIQKFPLVKCFGEYWEIHPPANLSGKPVHTEETGYSVT